MSQDRLTAVADEWLGNIAYLFDLGDGQGNSTAAAQT